MLVSTKYIVIILVHSAENKTTNNIFLGPTVRYEGFIYYHFVRFLKNIFFIDPNMENKYIHFDIH